MEQAHLPRIPGLAWLAKVADSKKQSLVVRSATERVDGRAVEAYLAGLGVDELAARNLVDAVDEAMPTVVSLSSLTSPLALDYLDRLSRPIPVLTPLSGAQILTRSYLAHVVTERDPGAFGAPDVPVLGTLPPLNKRGSPPQDLLTRVVKAARGNFEVIRAVPTPVWNGLVRSLVRLAHDQVAEPAPSGDRGDGLLALEVVDGLARVGWVLRQVDLHYGLEPDYRPDSR
jgi:hypothetical protein